MPIPIPIRARLRSQTFSDTRKPGLQTPARVDPERFPLLPQKRRIDAIAALVVLMMAPAWVGRAQPADVRVHDPVMIEQGGTYYMFSTGRGISVMSSADMQEWERIGSVFDEAPEWVSDVVPDFRNHIWAPDISFHDGRYRLFYSISSFGKNTSAIGVATNATLHPDDPDFEWVDHGPVVRSVPGRDMWNAIDPNLAFDDENAPWLVFGSFWEGIKLTKLSADLSTLARPQEWYTVAARHRYWKLDERDAGDPMNSAVEAPFIFKKGDYYYLFVSWDRCCAGEESTYKIVVGRADEISGPYLDRSGQDMRYGGGTLVAAGDSLWSGVGHNAAYTIDGIDYLVFHAYDRADEGRSKLRIEEMKWDAHEWPFISPHD